MAQGLKWELVTYRAALPDLLDREGQWVVIHQSEIAGVWPSFKEALSQGYRRYGSEPWLVKLIAAVEPVEHSSRDLQSPRRDFDVVPDAPQYLIVLRCPEGVVYPNSIEGESLVNQPSLARKFASVGDAMDWAAARPDLVDGYEMTVELFIG